LGESAQGLGFWSKDQGYNIVGLGSRHVPGFQGLGCRVHRAIVMREPRPELGTANAGAAPTGRNGSW